MQEGRQWRVVPYLYYCVANADIFYCLYFGVGGVLLYLCFSHNSMFLVDQKLISVLLLFLNLLVILYELS
jgi:hypothetical protein